MTQVLAIAEAFFAYNKLHSLDWLPGALSLFGTILGVPNSGTQRHKWLTGRPQTTDVGPK
jgi:hypothetical protein